MSVINVSKKVTRSGYEFFFDVSLLTHARHIMGLSPRRHGIIVVNPNGTITYLPGWAETEIFSYSVTHDRGGIAAASAGVIVQPSKI